MITPDDIFHSHILIADDKEANVILLERMLRNAGYFSVSTTTDPRQVYALHLDNHYDLILLDLLMPDMNGFEVMEKLKSIEADSYLPVLVITAQPDQKLAALKAGARDFISKPFDLSEVLLRVRNMLEVRLLHKESRQLHKESRQLNDELLAEKQQSLAFAALPGTMVGIEKEERLSTHWFRSFKMRHPWLQINLFTVFAAAAVVGLFQDTIDRLLILTIFLPVMAGQSISTGSQTLAITLRGMTLGDLTANNKYALIRKEALLGLLNGIFVGLVAAIGMFLVASILQPGKAPILSAVVFLAMMLSSIISSICGAVIPLVLKRLGADPVIGSGIVMTTVTDVASMGLLLGLATILVT